MNKILETQVLIIGGGIAGTSVAREISKYKVRSILVEKGADLCCGQTKSSHGSVYSGIGLPSANSAVLKSVMSPESSLFEADLLKTRFATEGYDMFEEMASELDIPYKRVTSLVVAKDEEDMEILKREEETCKIQADLTGRDTMPKWMDKEALQSVEPNLSPDVIAGLTTDKWKMAIYPWELAIAMAENAKDNGVDIMTGVAVQAIRPREGGFTVETTKGSIETQFIVNAAGGNADKIAEMAGVRDFGLSLNKTQMLILDKSLKGIVNTMLIGTPRPGLTIGINICVSGNPYLLCGKFNPTEDVNDTATTPEWFAESLAYARKLVPMISEKHVIKSFVGVRAFNTRTPEDHIIEAAQGNRRFINMAIRLPGIASSIGAGRYVVDILGQQGLELDRKGDFNPYRKGIPRVCNLDNEEKKALIKKDSKYGRVVCHCETVTEGEIVEAIRRGARTIKGIQYRTRAGMGRCQRNFCGPQLIEILARELGIPINEVAKGEPGSMEVLLGSK